MDPSLLGFGDQGWGDEMLRGALMTLAVALAAFGLGLVFACLGAAAKLSARRPVRLLGEAYTTLMRGVPELLTIYLLYFGTGVAVAAILRGLFGYEGFIDPPAFLIGVVALAVVSGAYATEVLRGAYLAVPKGQIEAAVACGMGGRLLFRRILVPQVLRYALPGLGNVWQLTLKDTSLISVTGLTEIMRQAFVASGSTRQPFLFYLCAAALYLVFTTLSNGGFRRAEAWAGRGVGR